MKYIEVVKAVREEQLKKEASVKKLAGLLKKKAAPTFDRVVSGDPAQTFSQPTYRRGDHAYHTPKDVITKWLLNSKGNNKAPQVSSANYKDLVDKYKESLAHARGFIGVQPEDAEANYLAQLRMPFPSKRAVGKALKQERPTYQSAIGASKQPIGQDIR